MEAGRLLRKQRAAWNQVTSVTQHDIKLQADRAAETVILKILKEGSPYPILSEEAGELKATNPNSSPRLSGESSSSLRGLGELCGKSSISSVPPDKEYLWIVDPLDGTVNYSRGTPLSAVSIGLWQNNKPVYGVIYDFWRDELFHGGSGFGAFMGYQSIKVSGTTDPQLAILATGFPANSDHNTAPLQQFLESVQRFKKIRLLGTAALSMAYVACGRTDAYMERDIMLWDIAAGAAIVQGAGGVISIEPSSRVPNACLTKAAASIDLLNALESKK
ncbi:MAG: hypothetical protein A2283_02070 [Lentisphaerae bacterium RIFOXYA12_FULL_48_11]|nr:MAG: hypothetical protein A2283_02070 [Lentisphaerae bacterium RIFOXYA12_FULL_48_11]